jgi:hypothetical protein
MAELAEGIFFAVTLKVTDGKVRPMEFHGVVRRTGELGLGTMAHGPQVHENRLSMELWPFRSAAVIMKSHTSPTPNPQHTHKLLGGVPRHRGQLPQTASAFSRSGGA